MGTFITLTICTLSVLITYIIKYLYSRRNLYKSASKIPGPPSYPFIGSSHWLFGMTKLEIIDIFMHLSSYANEDGMSKVWLGPFLYIIPLDPDMVQSILKQQITKEKLMYKFVEPYVAKSIITTPAELWKSRRKMLTPAFNQNHLNSYFEIILDKAEVLIDKLSVEVDAKEFDVLKYTKLCMMDVISETALEYKCDYQNGKNKEFVDIFDKMKDLMQQRMLNAWIQVDWAFKFTKYAKLQNSILNRFQLYIEELLNNKKLMKNLDKNANYHFDDSPVNKSYVDILLENHKNGNISKIDRDGEFVSVTFGGSDTTSITISFVLMVLGFLTHIQDNVLEELKGIFGDSDRPLVKEDLPKMKYLEYVIKETMRLFPVSPILARSVTSDMTFGKYTIPTGSSCFILIYKIHRLEKIWGPDAAEFNPNRFSPENFKKSHASAFMPFSAGPRNCAGKSHAMMSMKVLLCQILRAYEIRSKIDYKKIKLSLELLISAADGHLISIKRRK